MKAFTAYRGTFSLSRMSNVELAQSMPCKEEEDKIRVSLDKKNQAVNLTDGVFG